MLLAAMSSDCDFWVVVAESLFGQHLSVGQKPFPSRGDIYLLTGRIDSSV